MSFQLNITLCRVCLQENGGTALAKDAELLTQFRFTTQLKMIPNDGIPDIICGKCTTLLRIAYKFRFLALASDKHLRSFVSKVQNEFNSIIGQSPSKTVQTNLTDEEMAIAIEEGVLDPEQIEMEEITPTTKFEIQTETENIEIDTNPENFAKIEYTDGSQTTQSIEVFLDQDVSEQEYIDETYDDEVFDAEEELDKKEEIQRELNESTGNEKKPRSKSYALMRKNSSSDPKPYECLACHKLFRTHGTLKQHTYIHTGERPYKCKVCQRGFTQSKSLISHVRIHTGEKPFRCPFCDMPFRQKDNLKNHVTTKHTNAPVKTFDCLECGKSLKSKYSLRYHMEKVH